MKPGDNPIAPYAEGLERAVLACCLIDGQNVIDVRATLKPDEMFILRHEMILKAIYSLQDRGTVVDLITVSEELDSAGHLQDVGGTAYLAELMSYPISKDRVEHYARGVADKAYRRRLLAAADEIKRLAYAEDIPIERVRNEAPAKVEDADQAQADEHDVVSMRELMGGYIDYMDTTEQLGDGVSGVPTGFRDFDELLDGAQKGSFNVFAGRPGSGKTAWLLCVAINAAKQGKKVYFWSGEMPKEQLRERIGSILTGIHTGKLRRGFRSGGINAGEYSTFVREVGHGGSLSIWVDDYEDMTPALLYSRVSRLARRIGGLDLIIIDHVGLLEPGVKKENRDKELGYITRRLKKQVAKVAPIWGAAQLSRKVEERSDKRPVMSDLRDSGNYEQDADTVTFIYRDVVYNEATEFPNRAELITVKNRHGGIGTVLLHFEKSRTYFSDAYTTTIDLSAI